MNAKPRLTPYQQPAKKPVPRLHQIPSRVLNSRSRSMDNEELAALGASLLAAERQPPALKVRQARLSALLGAGADLLPYVLSPSCSDPRDRTCRRAEMVQLRVLEGGADLPC